MIFVDYVLFLLHILDLWALPCAPPAWYSVTSVHPFLHAHSLRDRYSGCFNSLSVKQVSTSYPCECPPKGMLNIAMGYTLRKSTAWPRVYINHIQLCELLPNNSVTWIYQCSLLPSSMWVLLVSDPSHHLPNFCHSNSYTVIFYRYNWKHSDFLWAQSSLHRSSHLLHFLFWIKPVNTLCPCFYDINQLTCICACECLREGKK